MPDCQICGAEKAEMRVNLFASHLQGTLAEILSTYENLDKSYKLIIKDMPMKYQTKY